MPPSLGNATLPNQTYTHSRSRPSSPHLAWLRFHLMGPFCFCITPGSSAIQGHFSTHQLYELIFSSAPSVSRSLLCRCLHLAAGLFVQLNCLEEAVHTFGSGLSGRPRQDKMTLLSLSNLTGQSFRKALAQFRSLLQTLPHAFSSQTSCLPYSKTSIANK